MEDYSSAVLRYPEETVKLLLKSGDYVSFNLYSDDQQKNLVKCDLCHKFIVLGAQKSTVKISNHRDSKDCKKRVSRQEKHRLNRLTRMDESVAFDVMFGGQSRYSHSLEFNSLTSLSYRHSSYR